MRQRMLGGWRANCPHGIGRPIECGFGPCEHGRGPIIGKTTKSAAGGGDGGARRGGGGGRGPRYDGIRCLCRGIGPSVGEKLNGPSHWGVHLKGLYQRPLCPIGCPTPGTRPSFNVATHSPMGGELGLGMPPFPPSNIPSSSQQNYSICTFCPKLALISAPAFPPSVSKTNSAQFAIFPHSRANCVPF